MAVLATAIVRCLSLAEIALAFFNEFIKAVEDEVEAWGDFLGVAVGDEPFEGGLDGGGVVVVEDVKRLDGEGGLPPGGDGFPK